MVRGILIIVVAVLGLLAFGFAWLSRNERAGLLLFSGFGVLCWALVATAFLTRANWVLWALAPLAVIGVASAVWALVMVTAITNHFEAMRLRTVALGQTFHMSSAARAYRVDEVGLRFAKVEATGPDTWKLTLQVEVLQKEAQVVLYKGQADADASTVVEGYRIRLVDVSAANANKLALYTAQLVVTKVE